MRILERKLDYNQVLIAPQRSELDSRSNVNLTRTFKGKWGRGEITCTPIIISNMWNTGTKEMALAVQKNNILTALHKFYTVKELEEFLLLKDEKPFGKSRICFLTIGESDEDFSKIKELRESANKPGVLTLFINIDVANGYRNSFVKYVNKVREICDRDWIMAGNVTTSEMTQELLLNGADIVKIGIGPGSVCETRKVCGVGYPMLSAIIECSNVAHGLKGFICADGGCKISADICKAFCAGTDFVMLGGMVAGTDECQGEWVDRIQPGHTGTFLKFFGMSSYEAMTKFGGKEKEYRASEGTCTEVSYKGPVSNVIKEICGGLRSCGSYIGATRIKDYPKCATFVQI